MNALETIAIVFLLFAGGAVVFLLVASWVLDLYHWSKDRG
jgi:hypothetical protein